MASYLITGTSRGIGLSLATHLLARPAAATSLVILTARSPPNAALTSLLDKHGDRARFVQLDVDSAESVSAAAKEVAGFTPSLDVLISNAGVMSSARDGIASMTSLPETLHTNVVSIQTVTTAFLPLLSAGAAKAVINISTTLGSLSYAPQFAAMPVPAYKVSKAALNMLTRLWAFEYADKGFSFVTLSPGWVKTDLGGQGADLEVEQSSPAVLEIVDRACVDKEGTNGKFFDVRIPGTRYVGGEAPW